MLDDALDTVLKILNVPLVKDGLHSGTNAAASLELTISISLAKVNGA
jgi:hypothetical protein